MKLKRGDKCILTQEYLDHVGDKVSDLHFSFLNKTLIFDKYEHGCAFVVLERGFKVVGEDDVIPYSEFSIL